MIFLAATQPCTLDVYGAHFVMEPMTFPEVNTNHILVMEGELGRRILQREHRKIKRITFDAKRLPSFPLPLPPLDQVGPGNKIIVIRGGGIGDVIMCLPAIRELRCRLADNVHISLATFKMNTPLFSGQPDLDAVMGQPLTLGELMQADYFVEFKDPESLIPRIHMTDYYLKCFGFEPAEVPDKIPVLSIETLLDPQVAVRLNEARAGFKSMVYLNGLASDRLRDIPLEVLAILPARFPDILFVIPKGYADRLCEEGLKSLTSENIFYIDTEGSLSGYITTLNACDVLVTGDTSTYHIAAALNKPALVLFGPVGSNLRTTYYPSVWALDACYLGRTCRSPCGKSMYSEFYGGRTDGEKRCPEAVLRGEYFSPCLASFADERLVEAFEHINPTT